MKLHLRLISVALIALTGCASAPPAAGSDQEALAKIETDECGKPPVRTLKSLTSPRLVKHRACEAQARSDSKSSEEPSR